jgi:hypothetical protein
MPFFCFILAKRIALSFDYYFKCSQLLLFSPYGSGILFILDLIQDPRVLNPGEKDIACSRKVDGKNAPIIRF